MVHVLLRENIAVPAAYIHTGHRYGSVRFIYTPIRIARSTWPYGSLSTSVRGHCACMCDDPAYIHRSLCRALEEAGWHSTRTSDVDRRPPEPLRTRTVASAATQRSLIRASSLARSWAAGSVVLVALSVGGLWRSRVRRRHERALIEDEVVPSPSRRYTLVLPLMA